MNEQLVKYVLYAMPVSSGNEPTISGTQRVYLAADVDALLRQREEEIDKLNGELHDKDVVPRSRYDACNKDWLEAEQKVREVGGAAIKEIELLRAQLAASRARCKQLEDWVQFLRDDDNDLGLYATNGESCVDFYRNCDMALEGKPVPVRTPFTERPPA